MKPPRGAHGAEPAELARTPPNSVLSAIQTQARIDGILILRRERARHPTKKESEMRKFMIERDIPGVGSLGACELSDAATTSNDALAKLAPRVQWQQSYVTGNKTFCVYLAEDEDVIREHAELSGFPANVITEITGVIDPATSVR
jgi:hypothetical protein